MTQAKKWVFTELVQDSDDPMQLIAYAMYKADKDDHAIQCRTRLMSEEKISEELSRFHDSIAHSSRKLDDYRDKARSLIDELIVGVSDGVVYVYNDKIDKLNATHLKEKDALKAAFEKDKAALKAAHEKEIKKIWKDWTTKAQAFTAHLLKEPWYKAWPKGFGKWLFSGIPGLLATVFTTAAIIAGVSIFSNDGVESSRKALHTTIDTLMKDNHGMDLPPLTEPNPNVKKP